MNFSLADFLTPRPWVAALLLVGAPSSAGAISPDNVPSKDNRPEAELAAFSVHEDFRVELFADESLGIANPIAIHWDSSGRLWVLCTLAYAQLKPGEVSDDRLVILEDSDGDGRADRSTVFADGLDMPTGFALGGNGVYLAEGSDLVFLEDTDEDDRVDRRKVLLSGFGTGDTHQNIGSLVFDPGGFLYFTQGLHTYSQVETPWGVSRGDTAGFWRFDPRRLRLHPYGFPSMTSQNPWGAALDRWGALFIKSNGTHLCFATPGLVPTTHHRELMQFAQVGQTPGKSMSVEIVESAHLPGWIQGQAIIAGYFAREISAIPLKIEGAGFSPSPPTRLLYGGHPSFRPVDIRQGPDGAIYFADWFNPIINHYQVSLRHPDRDYSHGRIWRLVAKDRQPTAPPDWSSLSLDARLSELGSEEKWNREQALRLLTDDSSPDRNEQIMEWALELDPRDPEDALALTQAAGLLEARDLITPDLLDHLQSASNPYVRATVARIIGRAAVPIEEEADRLSLLLRDPHPRPRLEAVIACANRPRPDSLPLALTVLDIKEPDRFIEYALRQAVFALEAQWRLPAETIPTELLDSAHLAFVLETYGGESSATIARQTLLRDSDSASQRRLHLVLARLGSPQDLQRVFDFAESQLDAELLLRLVENSGTPSPPVPGDRLRALIDSPDTSIRNAGIRLAGRWRMNSLASLVESIALNPEASIPDRAAALESLASIEGKDAVATLRAIAGNGDSNSLREAALEGLVRVDLPQAAKLISELVILPENETRISPLVTPLLSRSGGLAALGESLASAPRALLEKKSAGALLTFLNLKGRTDKVLTPLLNETLGLNSGAPDYDPKRIETLVRVIREGAADPERGREIYERPALGCVACHRIDDAGGVIGPALTTVGAGLPLDQIIESILWPGRQVKEGYQALSITRTDGRVITGYLEREGEDILWYRNTTTPWILPLELKDVATRQAIPTLMPAGLTSSLSEEELRDLVAYLASLDGSSR